MTAGKMTVGVGSWKIVDKVIEAVGDFVGGTNIEQLYVQIYCSDYNGVKIEHFDCSGYFVHFANCYCCVSHYCCCCDCYCFGDYSSYYFASGYANSGYYVACFVADFDFESFAHYFSAGFDFDFAASADLL